MANALVLHRTHSLDKSINTHFKKCSDKNFVRFVKNQVKSTLCALSEISEWSSPFIISDISLAINQVKKGKAPGPENVFAGFLKNIGSTA